MRQQNWPRLPRSGRVKGQRSRRASKRYTTVCRVADVGGLFFFFLQEMWGRQDVQLKQPNKCGDAFWCNRSASLNAVHPRTLRNHWECSVWHCRRILNWVLPTCLTMERCVHYFINDVFIPMKMRWQCEILSWAFLKIIFWMLGTCAFLHLKLFCTLHTPFQHLFCQVIDFRASSKVCHNFCLFVLLSLQCSGGSAHSKIEVAMQWFVVGGKGKGNVFAMLCPKNEAVWALK